MSNRSVFDDRRQASDNGFRSRIQARLRAACSLITMALLASVLGGGQSPATASPDAKKSQITFELGPVWQSSNDVAIPRNATRFSINGLTGVGPYFSFRLAFRHDLTRTTGLRFLIAPFSLEETGTLDRSVSFAGGSYSAGVPTTGTYQFNSYRMTYWYRFHRDARSDWRAGLTLKVRDARIALRQGNTATSDYNLGIVPLLHLSGEHQFAKRWRAMLDFDGLAAPQGRAFDLGLQLGYDVAPQWVFFVGYRLLEGGVDIDRVYNFAFFNYLTTGISYRY